MHKEGAGGCRRVLWLGRNINTLLCSECAVAQSIALRCQITLEWTAAMSTSTPSVCHDAATHFILSSAETESGEGEQMNKEAQKGRFILSWAADSDGTFLSSLPSPLMGNHRVHCYIAQRHSPPAFLWYIRQTSVLLTEHLLAKRLTFSDKCII